MVTRETFMFFPPPPPAEPCAVTLAGTSYCQGDYLIERTAPVHSVLEYIEKGRGTVTVGGKTWEPKAGDFYLLLPDPDHRYASSSEDPWVKHWFNVAGPLVPALAELYGIAGVVHFPECPVGPLFAKGHQWAKNNPNGCGDKLASLFHQVLLKARQGVTQAHGRGDDLSDKLLRYLEAHWREKIPLTAMADLVGLSRAQVVRRFRAAHGVPPHQWILRRRMNQAQTLLLATRLSIRDVARHTGFDDEYHFATLFKRHVGRSPGHWRAWRAGMKTEIGSLP